MIVDPFADRRSSSGIYLFNDGSNTYFNYLMERIVYKHVYNHLVNNSLIYKYQSGFLPKHSTVHQLLELFNSILKKHEGPNT
jgi:hypothetical protein